MPAPKRYRTKRLVIFNAELDILTEFEEICHTERKSVTAKLNELMLEAVETNGIGKDNPLGITFGPSVQQKITNFNAANPLETLDLFIDNGIIGAKQWQPAFAEVEDQRRMERYFNLTEIMHTSAKDRLSFLKTGKAVVSTGRIQTLPTMKGTRSGF